jgi:biopolymer transport protein ExbD
LQVKKYCWQNFKQLHKKDLSQVHIRGDQLTHFEAIDQVISTTKEAGIGKIAFLLPLQFP